MKKYEINKDGCCVALRSFGDVEEGDIGGFIESEKNLSHEGNCWVYENARVFGNAFVSGNTHLTEDAPTSDAAKILENLLDSPVESLTMDGITYKKTAAKWERA